MMSGVSHAELLDDGISSSNKLMPVMGNVCVGVLGKDMVTTGSSMPRAVDGHSWRHGIVGIERS